jgi:CMP-N-acetylneuraminic acid synthetase
LRSKLCNAEDGHKDKSFVQVISWTFLKVDDPTNFSRLNGAIYICETNRLLSEEIFFIKDNIFSFGMSQSISIDIDEELVVQFIGRSNSQGNSYMIFVCD